MEQSGLDSNREEFRQYQVHQRPQSRIVGPCDLAVSPDFAGSTRRERIATALLPAWAGGDSDLLVKTIVAPGSFVACCSRIQTGIQK